MATKNKAIQTRKKQGSIGDFTAISLFSGAGGLDLGLELVGWDIRAQIEMDHDCANTLRGQAEYQKTNATVVCAKIEDINPRDLRKSLKMRRGELGLLVGGPPCQPFTTTGLRQGINDRRASSAFPKYLEYVEELSPKTLLIENVDGMLSAALKHRPLDQRGKGSPPMSWEEKKGSFLHWFLQRLSKLGYSVTWGVVEAADYGVPQLRQRAVLIGVRGSSPCYLPSPTHGREGLSPYRTLRDALKGITTLGAIQPLSARKAAVFELIPPGQNWRCLPEKVRRETMGAAFHAEGGKGGWWRRLSWDEPSPTILGMPDHSSTALIHPDEVRCLSVTECAAVQTFPKWVKFSGRPRSQYQQIGNAVPVRVGSALGKQIRNFLNGIRTEPPSPPVWRRESANRRIGTHGWVRNGSDELKYEIIGRAREDHVWTHQPELQLG